MMDTHEKISDDLILKNGYIQILGCKYLNSELCYHKQIQISLGPEDLPSLKKNTSFSLSDTDVYELADTTLASFSISSVENSDTDSVITFSYDLQNFSNQSYIISIRDSLNHSLTVSPGQVVNLDLP